MNSVLNWLAEAAKLGSMHELMASSMKRDVIKVLEDEPSISLSLSLSKKRTSILGGGGDEIRS